jgi:hypothetical protein
MRVSLYEITPPLARHAYAANLCQCMHPRGKIKIRFISFQFSSQASRSILQILQFHNLSTLYLLVSTVDSFSYPRRSSDRQTPRSSHAYMLPWNCSACFIYDSGAIFLIPRCSMSCPVYIPVLLPAHRSNGLPDIMI